MATSEQDARLSWRHKRIVHLVEQIEAGTYSIPPPDVVHAILHGRPKWGDDPRDARGIAPLIGLNLTEATINS